MEGILHRYIKLNNSYKKKYIFHIGAGSGFYSELSNMISAILYCLKHQYKFILYSKDANFGFKHGWTDFFLPFCEESTFSLHSLYNRKNDKPTIRKKHYLRWVPYKLWNRDTFLTYQLWNKYFSKAFDKEQFDIPELGIKGDLREASFIIAKMVYRFNKQTQDEIDKYVKGLNLPKDYISMQIRRGDKVTECSLCPTQYFFDAATQHSDCKDLFILADDYRSIQEVKNDYLSWRTFTLTQPDELGYNNDDFALKSSAEKREKLIKLFSSIEVIKNSKLFIGTYTTNVGLFLGMNMPFDKIISVQKSSWFRFEDDDVKNQLA